MNSAARSALRSIAVLAAMAVVHAPSAIAADFDEFGLKDVTANLSTHEAGAHPDFSTTISVKTDPSTPPVLADHFPYAALKDLAVELPPGLIGNVNAVDLCTNAQFLTGVSPLGEGCPLSSQVGIAEVHLLGMNPDGFATLPIFRLEPTGEDVVARLGFLVNAVPVFVDARLRSESDYGVTAEVKSMAAAAFPLVVKTNLWGVPADSSHDTLRLSPKEALEGKRESPPRPFGRPPAPFLSNPTACGTPLTVSFKASSYAEPDRFVGKSAALGQVTGCEELEFDPSFSLAPTTREAASTSGAEATLTIPQNEGFDERVTSHLRGAVVRLPEGLAISPTAADGLAACSAEEVGYRVSPPPPADCPEASKIGTAEIDSPSLTRPLQGALYVRAQEPGHLTRVWLVADDLGAHVKIPGEFLRDPATGRITSLFLETPQVPVRELELHFKGGPRGVLATPRRCGTYETGYELTPWSGGADVTGNTSMAFDQNCAAAGFSPTFLAGTADPIGGAFTTLAVALSQDSGEENLSRLEVRMPPGVLARLRGVALCQEPAASAGACPPAARIGHSVAAAGFGPQPLWIPQPGRAPTAVYLAGPYKGAPYSLVVLTPAEAGPFDLGDVVVRVALHIDPQTAQVSAASDPLPQIVEGIPIAYRDIRVEINRSEFALNPTSCDPMAIAGSATSVEGSSAALHSRFQVGGCSRLSFRPRLSLRLRGGTRRGSHPSLRARLTMPKRRGANVRRAAVTLPRSLLLDQSHIRTVCTRVQFAADACPKGSIYGYAKAVTPLLDGPLKGPVYLRSSDHKLPDLVAALRSAEGIEIELVGRIDSVKGRIRSTFDVVPDAPVSSFLLTMQGGRKGLIVNSRNLCFRPKRNRARAEFDAHNGKLEDFRPVVRAKCAKKAAKRGKQG